MQNLLARLHDWGKLVAFHGAAIAVEALTFLEGEDSVSGSDRTIVFNHCGGFMRKMSWIRVSVVIVVLCLLIVPMCFGDSGCEFGPRLNLLPIPAVFRPRTGQTPPYPLRLSKDRQPDVRMNYAQQTQPALVIQEQTDGGYRIQNVFSAVCIAARPVIPLAEIMERTTDEPSVSQAFGGAAGD